MTADILIVGAGFTGAIAAAALADGVRRIVVLDYRPQGRAHFGGELIHAAGVDMLRELGLWRLVEGMPHRRVEGFRVSDAAHRDAVLLPYGDVPAARPGGVAIDHQDLVARAREHLARLPHVEVRAARAADVVWRTGRVAGVRTVGNEVIHAALTIVADGRHSRMRQALGIRARQRAVSLSALLIAPGALPPARGYAHICLGAPGPVLAYALPSGPMRFCIDVPMADSGSRTQIASVLRTRYAPMLAPGLRAGLLSALDEGGFDLCGNHTVSTDRCTVPGAALIGDAAGCSHPLTASGMTNSLSDIRILREELSNAHGALDAALARYEVRRYRFVRSREILADELYEAFRDGGAGSRAIRNGIFRYWRSSSRGRAATVALLSGDDARLTTFVGEYLRVMRQSVQGVVLGQLEDVSLRNRAYCLADLARDSLDLLNRVRVQVAGWP